MSNYATLKAAIQAAVYTNGSGDITGAGLQTVLLQMVTTIGGGYTFKGVANGGTSAGTPDENCFYIAPAGTYTNFGSSYTVPDGSIGVFTYNGSWTKTSVNIMDIEAERATIRNMLLNYVMESWANNRYFAIADVNGNELIRFDGGKFVTTEFDSDKVNQAFALGDLEISDESGNVVLMVRNGNVVTKNFDSSLVQTAPPAGTVVKPSLPIPVYLVCNDIDTSNRWGIGTRNRGASVYLDHFFKPTVELNLKFANGSTSHLFAPKVVGNGDDQGWNGNEDKLEEIATLQAGNDTLQFKVRSTLNSSTSAIKPIVLTVGDSVTQGWFGNYPAATGKPRSFQTWARYFFALDELQNGSGFDALFVGDNVVQTFSSDGVSGRACACGNGGWTAKKYVSDAASPFHISTGFSLSSYLSKYKTLADDGVTRLEVGTTAGTEVTDVYAWDVCTPNVVVIELGINDVLTEWKSYTADIISSIQTEFPTMKIVVCVLDACTANYPSLNPEYSGVFFDDYNSLRQKMLDEYTWAVDNMQDEDNGVFVLYAGAVVPLPKACNVIALEGSYDGSGERFVGVDSVERVPHPNRFGHEAIGYSVYSILKYIL